MSKFNDKEYYQLFDSYDPAKRPTINNRVKRKKKRRINYFRLFLIFLVLLCIVFSMIMVLSKCKKTTSSDEGYQTILQSGVTDTSSEEVKERYYWAQSTNLTQNIKDIHSEYAVLIDVTNKKVLAQKQMNQKMYPASMTKVFTTFVALEMIEDVNSKCTITAEMIDPYYKEGATLAGFTYDEQVPIIDIVYASLLKSGADAASALAIYTCGSEEAFMDKVNERIKELGLTSTHFTNPVGMHDENHYTTAYEMACMMEIALSNPVIEKALKLEENYVSSPTPEHPEPLQFKSTFIARVYKDMVDGMIIEGGKTGYTSVSKHSAVSFATTDDGRTLVLVTAKSTGNKYYPVYDCKDIYANYAGVSKPESQ